MLDITQEEIISNWGEFDINLPIISVRCITFNQKDYISQALDSFLMQKTTFPFEIVVHDDVSTDGTTEIINEYEKKYPLIIKPIYETENQYSKHDGSISRIMNSAMKGKYIAFCEGDDYWIDENKLQLQVDFLETHPDYTMCFHNAIVLDELNRGIKYKVSNYNREYFSTELYKKWIVPTASIVCRKEILNFPIKDRALFWASDVITVQSCAHMGRVYGFSDKMSVYRISSNGVTWQKNTNPLQTLQKKINHEIAIEENFCKINKNAINKKKAEIYFSKLIFEKSKKDKCKDLLITLKLAKGYILIILVSKIIHYLKRRYK